MLSNAVAIINSDVQKRHRVTVKDVGKPKLIQEYAAFHRAIHGGSSPLAGCGTAADNTRAPGATGVKNCWAMAGGGLESLVCDVLPPHCLPRTMRACLAGGAGRWNAS